MRCSYINNLNHLCAKRSEREPRNNHQQHQLIQAATHPKMNVRKQRQHQCGLSNIDFRTKGDAGAVDRYNPTLKFADTGTMSKHGFK